MTTAKLYNFFKQIQFAKDSESPSMSFLESVNAVWNKIKGYPSLLQPLQEAERLYGADSPFQSVLQMYYVTLSVKKAETEKLCWVFDAILDARCAGILKNDEIAKTKLQDKGRITPIDLFLFKYDVAQELLNPQLAALPFGVTTVAKLRNVFKDHRSYRNALGFKDSKEAGWTGSMDDVMWRSSLTAQEECQKQQSHNEGVFGKLRKLSLPLLLLLLLSTTSTKVHSSMTCSCLRWKGAFMAALLPVYMVLRRVPVFGGWVHV